MRRLTGWLFDVYATGDSVSVWLIDADGVSHHLHDILHPSFFVHGASADLRSVCEWLMRARMPVRLKRAERYEVFARRNLIVLQIEVQNSRLYPVLVRRIANTFPNLDLYTADLSIAQVYFFERSVFPLALCDVMVDEANHITEITTDDSRWALSYRLPPLRIMSIQMEGEHLNPNHGHRGALEISYEGRTYVVSHDDAREVVIRVREHLERADPNLIVTRWGDSFIIPQLLKSARCHGLPLPFNRDLTAAPNVRPARSYFSYGRIIFKTMAHTLYGRWHVDLENAALLNYGLEGAFELTRITEQPFQQTVRVSTGTGISAMEMVTAYAKGYLIPYRKREPEEFKSARDLLISDKGGLTYQPIVGLHFDVAELDFGSMYPAIMARFNVSPETVHCSCCPNSRVPELGYAICRHQRGIVPETLAPLIEKRFAYKRATKQTTSPEQKEWYRRLASAHKWLLVTCFGYLGYKNARFGRIEAHEAVTAYGREALLRAKEVVERRGFRVLHALTDSLWIQKRKTNEAEYAQLIREIEQDTQLPIELEGIYKWVAFLPSRVDARNAVPNRYFGAMRDGELKVRGIELRRRDTPEFIKQIQQALLDELALANTRQELVATYRTCWRL
ncbi:DNA polymerase, archaea type [Anaerolineae bacterium]|nr:DNA polymerase, archaea type [Anaerolineae bacterium]